MNPSTSAGSVQIMVLGWRCQLTEPNAVLENFLAGRQTEPLVDEVEGRPAQRRPRHLRDGVEVLGPVRRRQQDAIGPQHAGEFRRGPTGVRDVVQHVVRHDNVEGMVLEGKVLRVAGAGSGQLDSGQIGHGGGGHLDHARRQVGQGEVQVGEERRRAHPQQPRPATDLEDPPTLWPVDATHEPIEPGHVRPRVLGVQRNAGVEVAGIVVLAFPQVVPVGAQGLPARHDVGTVLIICKAGWSVPHSSGISSSGRKPQSK